MILRHLIEHCHICPGISIGYVALHDGRIFQRHDKIPNQAGAQIITPRLSRGQVNRNPAGRRCAQRFVDSHKAFRTDFGCHIDSGETPTFSRRFLCLRYAFLRIAQTVQPLIDDRLCKIHIRPIYPDGLQNLYRIRQSICNVFHTTCQSARPMRTKRNNRLAGEVIFLHKAEHCHRRRIPPIRKSQKNHIIVFRIRLCHHYGKQVAAYTFLNPSCHLCRIARSQDTGGSNGIHVHCFRIFHTGIFRPGKIRNQNICFGTLCLHRLFVCP